MRTLVLDIETIPSQRPDVLEEIRRSKATQLNANVNAMKPPGSYKKEEIIAAWWANEAPKIMKELIDASADDVLATYSKTGLDGSFGQICVVGFALDDAAPQTVWSADYANPNTERELLEDFYCALTDLIPMSQERSVTVVGHNVSQFDLRFMVQRSIVNGVRPHRVIATAAQAKPWDSAVFDTMTQWAGFGNRISLDKLCRALSIPTPKTDITGATVWNAVKAGRIAEVAAYCAKDIQATRAVHRRLTFAPTYEQAMADIGF